ncbi:hypothetical protein TYRP_016080 [Tyrophagus putrescentiae]|nr:hypothetical protein TYRP_016080 [Tyrophagus putrescentiae]
MSTSGEDYAITWSHSRMTTFKIKHIWKIDLFSDRTVPKGKLVSSKFSLPEHDIKFQLELYCRKGRTGRQFISLYLKYFPGKTIKGAVPVTFDLAFLKNDGSFMTCGEFFCTFKTCKNSAQLNNFCEYATVMNPENNCLHENHSLIVCCNATVNYNRAQVQFSPAVAANGEDKFKSNLKSLLDSGEHSDVVIVVGKTQFPVHKNILSTHSPVFQALFRTHDTVEERENKVIISDVSADTMKDFLQFIYTGVKPKDDRLTMSLLIVADKYQVDALKALCEDGLSQSLSTKDVVSLYLQADLYNALNLKAKCLNFIAFKYDQVRKTKDWKQMCKSGGDKMVDICNAIGSSKELSTK